jgi:hypothetical protein
MSLANVALTDTFDYWRTVTNSLVVALNDTLVFCNTSNANAVSIPSSISRTSNLYVNILTSSSVNDAAPGNVASALVVNTVHGLALSYVAAANSNAGISVASANAWSNSVAASANNWANTKLANTSGMSFAGSLSIPGTLTISTNNVIDTNGGRFRTGAGNFGVRIFPGGGTDTSASILQFTNAAQDTQWGSVVANGQFMYVGTQPGAGPLWFGTVGTTGLAIDTSNRVGIGTVSPAATLDVVGTVSIAKASVLSQTLTDGATINWDTSLGQVATITLGGARTMAAPTNLKVGTYILHVVQDGVGGRTITWNSVFKWPAGVAPTLTTTANRRDLFSFVCDGTNLYGSYLPDVR